MAERAPMKGNINPDMLLFVELAGRANADGSWESSRLTRPCLRAVRYGFHAFEKDSVSCA